MKGEIKFDNKNCKITTEKIIYIINQSIQLLKYDHL